MLFSACSIKYSTKQKSYPYLLLFPTAIQTCNNRPLYSYTYNIELIQIKTTATVNES